MSNYTKPTKHNISSIILHLSCSTQSEATEKQWWLTEILTRDETFSVLSDDDQTEHATAKDPGQSKVGVKTDNIVRAHSLHLQGYW